MSRDDRDPYTDAKTGTLENKLGIKEPGKLAQAEADYAKLRIAELREKPLAGAYDLKHLQGFHQRIFGDVYPWAGELRTVDISKQGSMFARPDYIESEGKKIFAGLAKDNHLKGMDRDTFVERAAFHLTEVNALHPFREGNGRAQYAMFEQLGREAGHALDFSRIDKKELVWHAAMAHSQDHSWFKPVIEKALDAGQRLEAERRVPPAPEQQQQQRGAGASALALDRVTHGLTAALERRALAMNVEPGPDGGAYFTHPLGEHYHQILSERGWSASAPRAPNGDIRGIDAAKLPPPNAFDKQLDRIESELNRDEATLAAKLGQRPDAWRVAYSAVAQVEGIRAHDRQRADAYLKEATAVPLGQRDRGRPEHHSETALLTALQDARPMTSHIANVTQAEIRHSIAIQLARGETPRADERAQASVHLHVASRNLEAATANRQVGLIAGTEVRPEERRLLIHYAQDQAGSFAQLTPAQQDQARARYVDAGPQDRKTYAVQPDGSLLSRQPQLTGAAPLDGQTNSPRFAPEQIARQIARYDFPKNDNPFVATAAGERRPDLDRTYRDTQQQLRRSPQDGRGPATERYTGYSPGP